MGKRNCCVPTCVNSWRNFPGVKYHTLPKDKAVVKEYKRLIRNDNLKEFSANTRICGNHFPGGERMSRTQLPSIFPWSKAPSKLRREIFKHDLPAKRKNTSVDFEAVANTSTVLSAEVRTSDPVIVNEGSSSGGDVDCGVSRNSPVQVSVDVGEIQEMQTTATEKEQAEEIQKLQNDRLKMQEEIDRLKKEANKLKYTLEKEPQFDIDEFKDNDADIAFYTGFQNYDTMILCFNVLKEKAANLSYGNHHHVNFDPKTKSGVKRKLSLWQEFTLVLLRLRLGLFEKDLANRYRVSVSVVSDICRSWIKFMKSELQPRCIIWPSKEQIKHYMPPVFKEFYPELVSIIDCTEIKMESPSSLDNQSLCYSMYKSHTTMKRTRWNYPKWCSLICK